MEDNCTKCGLTMDRDLNAAKNIPRLGLQSSVGRQPRCPRIPFGGVVTQKSFI